MTIEKKISNAEGIDLMAKRLARDIEDGFTVNLGIGMPTQITAHIPEGVHITLHSENGIVGMGAPAEEGMEDPECINAGGGFVTEAVGPLYVDSAASFGIVRGGHLDLTVLGALQVDQEGSIANWMIPGKFTPGIGGAMDLCAGAKKVIAMMNHMDKHGNSKVLKKCNLPLTGYKKLSAIITDMAYIEVTDQGLVLKEVAHWTNVDEVVKYTEAELIIPDKVGVFS